MRSASYITAIAAANLGSTGRCNSVVVGAMVAQAEEASVRG
jgi:hypothetical protein